jgi:hypothetical protein
MFKQIVDKIWSYLSFKKSGSTGFLKQMHLMNKISILMFLVALIVVISKIMK